MTAWRGGLRRAKLDLMNGIRANIGMFQAPAIRTGGAPPDAAPTALLRDGLASIEAEGSNHRFEADRPLFREGDRAEFCYKILAGAVRICKLMPDGRRQVTNFFLPGSILGFDLETQHGFTAETIVESVVRRYSKAPLDRLANERPGVAQQMLTLAVGRLASAQNQALALSRKSAMERLAGFLIGQADARTNIALPMSRLDIADYLGLTVETVSRLFTRLRRDGIIELPTAQSVVIRDRDALDELCDGP
jgi:CRP-like cAMP-binding protein